MIFLEVSMLIAILIFFSIAMINIFSGPVLSKRQSVNSEPLISILIPARNEDENIKTCLKSLQQQDYRNMEIIVLDDHSEDKTASIVEYFSRIDSRIRILRGKTLPDGWTGKNWACHQLSEAANGEILIFTDADNFYSPQAVPNTIGWMQRYNLDMLSAFPQQTTTSFSEKLIVPIIDVFVYGSLVLWLTYRSPFSSLAAANGQWIAFRKESYLKIHGHCSVKGQIVEDVSLARQAKKENKKILTLAGTGIVYGKMYHSFKDVWDGFSKNLFGLVSNKTIPFFAILTGLVFTYILPYQVFFLKKHSAITVLVVALNIFYRGALAIKYRHPILISVLLHPFSILTIIAISINSFIKVKLKKIYWKGRLVVSDN